MPTLVTEPTLNPVPVSVITLPAVASGPEVGAMTTLPAAAWLLLAKAIVPPTASAAASVRPTTRFVVILLRMGSPP